MYKRLSEETKKLMVIATKIAEKEEAEELEPEHFKRALVALEEEGSSDR